MPAAPTAHTLPAVAGTFLGGNIADPVALAGRGCKPVPGERWLTSESRREGRLRRAQAVGLRRRRRRMIFFFDDPPDGGNQGDSKEKSDVPPGE